MVPELKNRAFKYSKLLCIDFYRILPLHKHTRIISADCKVIFICTLGFIVDKKSTDK